MTRLVLALIAGLTLSQPVAADPSEAGARATISAQLEAFRADDFARAFTFASPMIKGIFVTPEGFEAMVKQGYPMVWRHGGVRFLNAEPAGGGLRQKVMITDQAGQIHVLEYQMIPAGDGWQINGVRRLEAPQLGA